MPGQGTAKRPSHQVKGEKLRLHKASRRTLESWANHYGFKHLADTLPLRERAAFYKARLYEIQKQGRGPFFGQPMTRVPMAKSDWPSKGYLWKKGEELRAQEQKQKPSDGSQSDSEESETEEQKG
ncbi:hypothetical protein DFH06DRAFT_143674 [Mycena polygramma]|nr:hypothetical protein DFH06DRAFT_143674 [Mycena polygramma]